MKLSLREQVYLWRRRKGLRQSDLAARLGIHTDTLGERERGQDGELGGIPGGVGQLKATAVEELVIRRRRMGLSQASVAKRMGVSRHAVMGWEKGLWDWEKLARFLAY